jgi:putative FmdB family regulatory protein
MEWKKAGMAAWAIAFVVFAAAASTWWAVQGRLWQEGRPAAGAQASVPEGAIRENGSQPLVRARNLVLSGRVLGMPEGLAGLQVLVHVGEHVYAAQVQDRTYVIDIGVPDPAAMVVVEARAGTAHFKSLVGSVAYLRQHEGSDAIVEDREVSALAPSPFRSALYVRTRFVLGGRLPTNDTEVTQALRAAVTVELEPMTYVLARFAREADILPAGFESGLALVEDRTAYIALSQQGWVTDLSKGALWSTPDSAPIGSLSEFPDRLLMVSGLPYGGAPALDPNDPGLGANPVALLARQSDGSFDFYEDYPLKQPNYRARLYDGGYIELYPNADIHRSLWSNGNGVIDGIAEVLALRRLSAGHGVDVWVREARWEQWGQGVSGTSVEHHVFAATSLDAWSRQDGWPASTSMARMLPWFCEGRRETSYKRLENCDYVLHELGAGMPGHGWTLGHGWHVDPASHQIAPSSGRQPFSWELDARGVLRITSSQTSTEFWRLQGPSRSIGNAAYLARSSTGVTAGQVRVGITMTAIQTVDTLSSADALGTWGWEPWTGAWSPRYSATPFKYQTVRNSDGTSLNQAFDGSTIIDSSSMYWDVAGNAFFEWRATARMPDRSSRHFRSCAEATAAGAQLCAIQFNYFRPVLSTGDRYYGISEIYFTSFIHDGTSTTVGPLERLSSGPAYLSCADGPCMPRFYYGVSGPPATGAAPPSAQTIPPRVLDVETLRRGPTIRPVYARIPRLMPIYAFECTQCGHSFDRLQKLSDPDPDTCPSCGTQAVKRQLTAPSFRLAGSGWYETDFKKDGDKKRNLADGGEGAKPSSDSKPAESSPAKTESAPAKTDAKPATPSSTSST